MRLIIASPAASACSRVLGVDRAAFLQRDAFQIRCAVPVPFGAGAIGHEDIDLVAARLAGAFPVGVPRRVADYQQVDVALRACGPLGHRTEQHDLLRIGRRDDLGDRGVDPLLNRHFAPCYRVRSPLCPLTVELASITWTATHRRFVSSGLVLILRRIGNCSPRPLRQQALPLRGDLAPDQIRHRLAQVGRQTTPPRGAVERRLLVVVGGPHVAVHHYLPDRPGSRWSCPRPQSGRIHPMALDDAHAACCRPVISSSCRPCRCFCHLYL